MAKNEIYETCTAEMFLPDADYAEDCILRLVSVMGKQGYLLGGHEKALKDVIVRASKDITMGYRYRTLCDIRLCQYSTLKVGYKRVDV